MHILLYYIILNNIYSRFTFNLYYLFLSKHSDMIWYDYPKQNIYIIAWTRLEEEVNITF